VPPADAAFAELKAAIIARTGHFFYADKDDALVERIGRRLRETGAEDCAAYLAVLRDPLRGEAEWTALEAEITIGETFFFRYAEQFAALRERILPNLLERNAASRSLRIWSAGCATGAEAYSVAILLHEILGERLGGWRIRIIGSDINEAFLAAARRGRYSRWALRAVSEEEREQHFLASDQGTWTLRPQYRGMASFERHNLLTLLDDTSPLQFTDFDLILCRNVLIYFHTDTVARVVEALGRCLVPGGWMLLGHSEPNPLFAATLDPIVLPGTAAYRSPGAGAGAPFAPPLAPLPDLPAPWEPLPPPETPEPPPVAPQPRPVLRQAEAPPPAPVPASPAPPGVEGVRRMADLGDMAQAADLCRAEVERDPLNPALHFYAGLIAQALGMPVDAEEAFRRALYLQQDFALAHYHLGLMLTETGRTAAGRRAVANAARIAAALPGDVEVQEGDGLRAGELAQIARLSLGSPGTAGR
jgi:chemotaxis protein methyltransferase CheR